MNFNGTIIITRERERGERERELERGVKIVWV
jgi:hypothetical protein